MALNRRSIFRGLFASPIVAASRLLPTAPVALTVLRTAVGRYTVEGPISSLITATIRKNAGVIATTVHRNNALLRHLAERKS